MASQHITTYHNLNHNHIVLLIAWCGKGSSPSPEHRPRVNSLCLGVRLGSRWCQRAFRQCGPVSTTKRVWKLSPDPDRNSLVRLKSNNCLGRLRVGPLKKCQQLTRENDEWPETHTLVIPIFKKSAIVASISISCRKNNGQWFFWPIQNTSKRQK